MEVMFDATIMFSFNWMYVEDVYIWKSHSMLSHTVYN